MRRPAPRPAGLAIDELAGALAPQTTLARVQAAWGEVAGDLIAANCEPVSERAGVVAVVCSSAVWAQELDLLSPQLLERLEAALGGPFVTALRCRAAKARTWPGEQP